jgi:integrase
VKGCRPLSDEEVGLMARSFGGTFAERHKALFVVEHRTGFRMSELVSLRVGDVLQHGRLVDELSVQRRHMKGGKAGKTSGRTLKLHPDARAALSVWLEGLATMLKGTLDPQTPVFCSRVRNTDTGLRRAISREQAWRILKEAFQSNERSGTPGTHAMRKTFANRVYEKLNHDLGKPPNAMGHANIHATVSSLSFRDEEMDAAILAA